MPESMKEHFDLLWIVLGFFFTGLCATGLFIFNQMRSDLKEVKDSLKDLSEALSLRLNKVERDLNRLWGEHRATHEGNNHTRSIEIE